MSVAAEYGPLWIPFYQMVNFAGHVVNILINYTGHMSMRTLILRVAKLAQKEPEECFSLLIDHRRLVMDLLKDQNLSPSVRRAYQALQADPAVWQQSWREVYQQQRSTRRESSSPNLSSIPDVSEPSSDDFALVESSTAVQSTSSASSSRDSRPAARTNAKVFPAATAAATSKSRLSKSSKIILDDGLEVVDHDKESIVLHQSALPANTESFQLLLTGSGSVSAASGGSSFKCPQCPLQFTSTTSFSVHLRGHLLSYYSDCTGIRRISSRVDARIPSSPSPFTLPFDERLSAFLKVLARFTSDPVSVDALSFPSRIKFAKGTSSVASSKFPHSLPLLSGEDPTSRSREMFNRANPQDASKSSKKARKRLRQRRQQQHIAEKQRENVNFVNNEVKTANSETEKTEVLMVDSSNNSDSNGNSSCGDGSTVSNSLAIETLSSSENYQCGTASSIATKAPIDELILSNPKSPSTAENASTAASNISPATPPIQQKSTNSPTDIENYDFCSSDDSSMLVMPTKKTKINCTLNRDMSTTISSGDIHHKHFRNNWKIRPSGNSGHGPRNPREGGNKSTQQQPVLTTKTAADNWSSPKSASACPPVNASTAQSTPTLFAPLEPPLPSVQFFVPADSPSQIAHSRPADSYVLSLRHFLSKPNESSPSVSHFASSSAYMASAKPNACWNCFKTLKLDPVTGKPVYPCPLCKVKRPFL